jgi:steroid delta-isomerase-like uncharacterized protein
MADNASIIRAFYEAFDTKDLDKLATYAAADAQALNVPFGLKLSLRDDWETWFRAFPDGKLEAVNLVAQGDHVFAECVGRGTHTGTLKGPSGEIPATGRKVEVPLAEIFRFREGKIVELRYYFDAFGLYRQLGLGAPEAGAEARGAETAPPAQR